MKSTMMNSNTIGMNALNLCSKLSQLVKFKYVGFNLIKTEFKKLKLVETFSIFFFMNLNEHDG